MTKDRTCGKWKDDYLGRKPRYNLRDFRLRFRVPRALFFKIVEYLLAFNYPIWSTRVNAANRKGDPTELKVMDCLRYLGTGRSFQEMDDSARMTAETLRYYIKHF